jgi:hypothetical protein
MSGPVTARVSDATLALPPERVVLNLTQTPCTSQAVTWRTKTFGTSPRAELVRVFELMNPKLTPQTFSAQTSSIEIDPGTMVYHHSVVFQGLAPNTLYAYRVGDGSGQSEWNQFRTASRHPEPFTFLYFGDVQEQIHSMCSQVFRAALQTEPKAKFWLFAGDMVNNGPDDREWAEFFTALGWIPRTLPLVLVPGNHEYPDPRVVPTEDRHMTRLWRPQFTLPENGPKGLEETVFSFDYQDVCFVILNGNEGIEEQALWLENILSTNEQPWIIVSIHQPVYSISKRRNPVKFQSLFVPIFDRFSVDLVLQGHDHGYARTLPLRNNRPVSPQQHGTKEKGTVYVISNAGPKVYSPDSRYAGLMAETGPGQLLFQSIRVEKDTLKYTAFNLMQEQVDAFELHK